MDGYHDKSHRLRGVSGSAVRAEPLALCPDGPDRCGELFSTRNINEWGYRHREEGAKITRSLHYLRNTAEGREFGKDIRIFGLRQWLTDLYDSALRLNYAFLEKRERAYLTANLIDLALLLVRNGAAYAYLLWLTVTRGLPVSEFLLYFGAASGFAQWVTGLMEQFALLRKQSLDISTIREFLELPEPFRLRRASRWKSGWICPMSCSWRM